MVKLLLVLIIAFSANADQIQEALSSKRVFSSLLSSHLAAFNQHYPRAELKLRSELFHASLELVDNCNTVENYKCGLNQFSTMTYEERMQYYGLANTSYPNEAVEVTPPPASAASKDWRQDGAVGPIRNQGQCGSCWAFSTIGSIEGQYAVTTGNLVDFSEQEILECTYEITQPGYDGCRGGWYYLAYDYIKKNSHLALERSNPYKAHDGRCNNRTPNGMTATMVNGYVKVAHSDDALANAIAITPVSVAMLCTGSFGYYKSGVYDGIRDCYGRCPYANHALTAVGYTQGTFVIRNSWGTTWGNRGYIDIKRGSDTCCVTTYVYYPTMNKPTPVDPCHQKEDPNCKDKYNDCPKELAQCAQSSSWLKWSMVYCRKSCRFCNNIPLQDIYKGCAKRIKDTPNGCKDKTVALVCPKSCCEGDDDDDDDDDCRKGRKK